MTSASTLLQLFLRGLCDAAGARSVSLYLPIPIEGCSEPSLWHAGEGEPTPEMVTLEAAEAFAASMTGEELEEVTLASGQIVGFSASRSPDCRLVALPATGLLELADEVEEERRLGEGGMTGLHTPVAWIGIRHHEGEDPVTAEGGSRGRARVPISGPNTDWLLALGAPLVVYLGAVARNLKDAVTGLPDRKEFMALLDDGLAACREEGRPLSVLFVNPDDFLAVNESFGSEKGDLVVREIVDRVRQTVRSSDIVSRYGGVTFAVLLLGAPIAKAEEVSQRLLRALSDAAYLEGAARLEFSVGAAAFEPGEDDVHGPLDLVRRCDQALMAAKQLSGNSASSWEGDQIAVGGGFDRLAGIFTGSVSKDYRNMLLLWETVHAVAQSEGLDKLVFEIVDRLFATFKPRRCGLFQAVDGSKLELMRGLTQTAGQHGGQILLEILDLEPGPEALLSRAVEAREPEREEFSLAATFAGETAESVGYAIPLLAGSECLGSIYLEWLSDASRLDGTDLMFLKALGSQVGLAIDRVRLSQLEAKRQDAERRQLRSELATLRKALQQAKLIYRSSEMEAVLGTARKVASTDATVLITGSSGTGKELLAHTIHELSPRSKQRFEIVDCGAIPSTLIESELFGAEKGAYTGAQQRRSGRLAEAHLGTVLLDEIGELPLEVQSKLLRFVQSKQLAAVGGTRSRKVDVRILAATNRNLAAEVKAGRFREDLYYRLNVVQLVVPDLKDRPDDVIHLAQHFIEVHALQYQRNIRGLTPEAGPLMMSYSWPGNVRELQNRILQAVILCKGDLLTPEDLGFSAEPLEMESAATMPMAVSGGVAGTGAQGTGEVAADEFASPVARTPEALEAALEELRSELSTVLSTVPPRAREAPPLGRWLSEDLLLSAHRVAGQVADRGARILGLAKTTYRRRLQKAQAEGSTESLVRPSSWDPVRPVIEDLLTLVGPGDSELMDRCEKVLLAEIVQSYPGNTGLGSALLGVTAPTFRRRVASLAAHSPASS